MKIYVYLDESGSIHKNSKTRYFAVGGYFSLEQDKLKIKAKYKAVKLLINDCIIPTLNLQNLTEPIEFIISIDNRNIRVGELNNLETYLKTEFCIYDDDFKITYYDSKTNYGIQLADLIVNTFYNKYKDITILENVIKELKPKNFRVSIFPRKNYNK